MKNIKLTILGIVTLLFALTLNFSHALNNYGILNNKLHVEVLAQSNSGGGSGSGSDYAYFEELRIKHVYGYVIKFDTGVKVITKDLPIGANFTVLINNGLVYSYKACEGWSIARCDQSKVGEIVWSYDNLMGGGSGT